MWDLELPGALMDPDNMKSRLFSPDCSLDKASMSSKGFISHCKNLFGAQGPVRLLGSSLWRKV